MYFFKRRLLRRKGISIIEIVVSISISLIIISLLVTAFLEIHIRYKDSIIENREYFYTKEAFSYIENELIQNTKSTSLIDNKIHIIKNDGTEKEILSVSGKDGANNIQVNYYEKGIFKTSNIVLRNIKNFSVNAKKNIMYIQIVLYDDFFSERCLPLNY